MAGLSFRPFVEEWNKKIGGVFPYARAGHQLKGLMKLGYKIEDIADSFARYMDGMDAKYVSFEHFASKYGLYSGKKNASEKRFVEM